MNKFVFNEENIPEVKMKHSVLNSFDDHYVVYSAGGFDFTDSSDEYSPEDIEKKIYALVAWHNRLTSKN